MNMDAIMHDIFSVVKSSVNMLDAAARYGIEIDQTGKALCPFHSEKTPSFTVYAGGKKFHCFGCDTGGDVIDFVGLLFNLSPLDAAKKIDSDFGLGIDIGKPIPAAQMKQIRRKTDLRKAFANWERRTCNALIEYERLLTRLVELLRSARPGDEIEDAFVLALEVLPIVGHWVDTLIYGSKEEKQSMLLVYGISRKGVGKIA